MDDVKWERYGAAAGLLFVILILVGSFIAGFPPRPDDSVKKTAEYYADHHSAIRVSAFLTGLGAIAFLWFLGSLWSTLRRAAETRRLATIAAGGGIVAITLAVISSAESSSLAIRIGQVSVPHRQLAQAIGGAGKGTYLLALTIGNMASFGVAVLVGAASVAALRTRVFPVWLGWAGAILAIGWLVAGSAVSTDNSVIFTIGLVVFIAWLVWLLAISFFLFRPQEQAA